MDETTLGEAVLDESFQKSPGKVNMDLPSPKCFLESFSP